MSQLESYEVKEMAEWSHLDCSADQKGFAGDVTQVHTATNLIAADVVDVKSVALFAASAPPVDDVGDQMFGLKDVDSDTGCTGVVGVGLARIQAVDIRVAGLSDVGRLGLGVEVVAREIVVVWMEAAVEVGIVEMEVDVVELEAKLMKLHFHLEVASCCLAVPQIAAADALGLVDAGIEWSQLQSLISYSVKSASSPVSTDSVRGVGTCVPHVSPLSSEQLPVTRRHLCPLLRLETVKSSPLDGDLPRLRPRKAQKA